MVGVGAWPREPRIKLTRVTTTPTEPYQWQLGLDSDGTLWVHMICPDHKDMVSVQVDTHRITLSHDMELSLSPSVVCEVCGWHCFIDYSEVTALAPVWMIRRDWRKAQEPPCTGPSTSSNSTTPSDGSPRSSL